MSVLPQNPPAEAVRAIDLLARTVFSWVHQEAMDQRFRGVPMPVEEQSALAAGFIAGLRTRISLHDSEAALVAYVYAVMTGERAGAAALVDKLLLQEVGLQCSCSGYLHGLQAARQLLCEVQAVRSNPASDSPSDKPEPHFSWTVLN